MKLFTIGDSLSQGFMSGAAAQMNDSYSTLIARALGLIPHGQNYRFPDWPHGGLPINLEAILRRLSRVYGPDIRSIGEWIGVPFTVNSVLDRAENYYERGEGSEESPYVAPARHGRYKPEFFHNVASYGFDIADSWLVNGSLCINKIAESEDVWFEDEFLGPPSASFYRSALRMLNPSLLSKHSDKSQLDWLEEHAKSHKSNGGVESLLLWLGSNNALGTALDLKIRETPNKENERPSKLSHEKRNSFGWNLWHPDDFRDEYQELIDRLLRIIKNHGSPKYVFVGNVPHVTIAPLVKGIGGSKADDKGRTYFDAYTYFPFGLKFAKTTNRYLTRVDVEKIDCYIDQYNIDICKIIKRANKWLKKKSLENRFHIVDINGMFATAAYKRNNGNPTYIFPKFVEELQEGYGIGGQARLTTEYYHVNREGEFKRGGFFSLDGVHPSVLGQGLVAHEFLKVMKRENIKGLSGKKIDPTNLPWREIYGRDKLLIKPIDIMEEIYEHEEVISFIAQVVSAVRTKDVRKVSI